MAFTHRSIVPEDLETCFDNLRDGFAFKPSDKKRLLALWRELIDSQSWTTVAIEDRRLPRKERLVGFGISVFITDEFARRALSGLPLLSRAFLEQWEKGKRPYLSKKEIAKANGGEGLNLLVLHFGWNEKRLTPEDMGKVQLKQTECFIESHAGYRVKEYLQEVYGSSLRDFVLSAGSSLRHDYRQTKWKLRLKGVSKEDWPYLTGFRPEEAEARAGTAASMLQAKIVEPRFRLAPSEQELLVRALGGKTDEELAVTLRVSHWTVKKRWQSIYLKVKKADPELLMDLSPLAAKHRQRRRYLLDYLRHHPEELRPLAPRSL